MANTTHNDLQTRLIDLRRERENIKDLHRGARRKALTAGIRKDIEQKTGGRCHICGGTLQQDWVVDHVSPHSGGGDDEISNALPACRLCNNYKWDYLPEEFQMILKLGVWVRTQVEKGRGLGPDIAREFTEYEARRAARTKRKPALR